MPKVLEYWWRNNGYVPYGIFFADDTFIPLNRDEPELPRRPVNWDEVEIDEDVEQEPYTEGAERDIAEGDNRRLASWPGYLLFGGSTSWEGDGELRLLREDRSLVWLLHAEGFEGFCSATVSNGTITALSKEYSPCYRWTLSVLEPWDLKVERIPYPETD